MTFANTKTENVDFLAFERAQHMLADNYHGESADRKIDQFSSYSTSYLTSPKIARLLLGPRYRLVFEDWIPYYGQDLVENLGTGLNSV